jgi:hypothetical protein
MRAHRGSFGSAARCRKNAAGGAPGGALSLQRARAARLASASRTALAKPSTERDRKRSAFPGAPLPSGALTGMPAYPGPPRIRAIMLALMRALTRSGQTRRAPHWLFEMRSGETRCARCTLRLSCPRRRASSTPQPIEGTRRTGSPLARCFASLGGDDGCDHGAVIGGHRRSGR